MLAAHARAMAMRIADQSRPAHVAPSKCNCQCHGTFLPESERTGVPDAVAHKLCQSCYDEFYADWTLVIDELTGAENA